MRVCLPLLLAVILTEGSALAEPTRAPARENLDIDSAALTRSLASLEDQRQQSTLLRAGTLDALARARSSPREAELRSGRARISPSLRFTRKGFRAVLVAAF